jgi:hypothetical protein
MTAPQVAAAASPAADAQAAQAGLTVLAARDLAAAWASMDLSNLSLPRLSMVVAGIVRRYGAASGALATRFYEAQRAAAGLHGPYRPRPADVPSLDQVHAAMTWATRPATGDVPNLATAESYVIGAGEKMVGDVGRNTIVGNVQRDPKARAWARVPEPGCCWFCAMLATRGAVYKADSFTDANARFADSAGWSSHVKTHDHCRCHVEPVFNAYEPSALIREWTALYHDTVTGKGPKQSRREFRHAFDTKYRPSPSTTPPGGETQ